MINAVLHLVTNKGGNFGSSLLPSYSNFTPYTEESYETIVRQALMINSGLYYLINSLISVYSFPDILSEFNETGKTFYLKDFRLSPVYISNAEYCNTQTDNFNILAVPDILPKNQNYFNCNVSYVSNTELSLSYKNKAVNISYEKSTGSDNRVIVAGEWPVDSGIKGAFKLPSGESWKAGYNINIFSQPIIYPYAEAVNEINKLSATPQLLANAGVARNYYNAQTSIEKYALLMLALANPKKRNIA